MYKILSLLMVLVVPAGCVLGDDPFPGPLPAVSITFPASGAPVSGLIMVSANASAADGGTIASVRFDFPNGVSATDAMVPFSTTWDSRTVADGSYMIGATATDDQGTTSTTSVAITVANGTCLDNTFSARDLPRNIPDADANGVTSWIPITGDGSVASLSLSLNITHEAPGDLSVTLISPTGTRFPVIESTGAPAAPNLVINSQPIPAFNGQPAAGLWILLVQDLLEFDPGRLNGWSIAIAGSCNPAR